MWNRRILWAVCKSRTVQHADLSTPRAFCKHCFPGIYLSNISRQSNWGILLFGVREVSSRVKNMSTKKVASCFPFTPPPNKSMQPPFCFFLQTFFFFCLPDSTSTASCHFFLYLHSSGGGSCPSGLLFINQSSAYLANCRQSWAACNSPLGVILQLIDGIDAQKSRHVFSTVLRRSHAERRWWMFVTLMNMEQCIGARRQSTLLRAVRCATL